MRIKYPNSLLVGLVLCSLFVSDLRAEAWYQNVPFYQGYSGYHTFRIPSLITAADGTLLAFAEGRKNSGSDTGDIDLVLRRSFDKGRTWQALQVVWDDDENTCGNPTPVVDRSNGRIWLFMTHNLGQDTLSEIVSGTSDGVRTIWSCYSDDNGQSWSVPVNRFSEVQPANTRWDSTGPGNGIQIENGSHVGRLVIPAVNRNIQSDDHGKTWYESAYLSDATGEGAVVELASGVLFRNDRASGAWKSYYRRIISYSYNQGTAWTAMMAHDELVCPLCQGSTISYVTDDDQRLILFSNPAATSRIHMTVKLSYNSARNWPVSKLIYKNNAAYSSLARLADDAVGLLYENGDGSAYHRISFVRFTIDWLNDETVFCWDFEEYAAGEEITAADEVEDVRGYALNGSADKAIEVVEGSEMYNGLAAAHFDGSGQIIRIDDAESKDILDFDPNDSFVIRTVFCTSAHDVDAAASSGALIAKDVGTSQPSWWLRVQGGKLIFFVDDGSVTSSVRSEEKVNDGIWHEVLAVRNAQERYLQIYVDGQLAGGADDNTSGSFANDNDVVIGDFNSGSRSFIGDIDKVQVIRGDLSDVVLLQQGDLNSDGVIDLSDFALLAANWIDMELGE